MHGGDVAFPGRELHGLWSAVSGLDADCPADGFGGRPRRLVRIAAVRQGRYGRLAGTRFALRCYVACALAGHTIVVVLVALAVWGAPGFPLPQSWGISDRAVNSSRRRYAPRPCGRFKSGPLRVGTGQCPKQRYDFIRDYLDFRAKPYEMREAANCGARCDPTRPKRMPGWLQERSRRWSQPECCLSWPWPSCWPDEAPPAEAVSLHGHNGVLDSGPGPDDCECSQSGHRECPEDFQIGHVFPVLI